jgi:hypothetical protein
MDKYIVNNVLLLYKDPQNIINFCFGGPNGIQANR